MMEPLRFSETSVLTRAPRRNIPEDGIFHRMNLQYRRENLVKFEIRVESGDYHTVQNKLKPVVTQMNNFERL
jgi:hypothetical protein